jgi:hypothetical protein
MMYYLWKDKDGIYFITDYKEIRPDGKVKIDGQGFMEAELVFSSEVKTELLTFARNQVLGGD